MAAGLGEALRLGADLGLDRTLLLDVLGGGAYGWYLGLRRRCSSRATSAPRPSRWS